MNIYSYIDHTSSSTKCQPVIQTVISFLSVYDSGVKRSIFIAAQIFSRLCNNILRRTMTIWPVTHKNPTKYAITISCRILSNICFPNFFMYARSVAVPDAVRFRKYILPSIPSASSTRPPLFDTSLPAPHTAESAPHALAATVSATLAAAPLPAFHSRH